MTVAEQIGMNLRKVDSVNEAGADADGGGGGDR
jgi:hypothetical protein